MRRVLYPKVQVPPPLLGGLSLLLVLTVSGCGGGGGDAGPPADVRLQASVAIVGQGVGAQATVSSVIVEVVSGGDEIDIPLTSTVTLDPPTGADVDLTASLVRESLTRVRLGSFDLNETGIHRVRIDAPGSQAGVILRDGGLPASELELGVVELAFERRADDFVIAPDVVTVALPTRGTTLSDSATFSGLPEGTEVQTQLVTHTGTTITRTDWVPAGQQSVVITDVSGGVPASAISGYRSRLSATTSEP